MARPATSSAPRSRRRRTGPGAVAAPAGGWRPRRLPPAAGPPLLAAAAAAALALSACGGGDDGRTTVSTPAGTTPQVTIPRTVDPADARAIRAWADTLRRGDVAGAARAFAIPSVVANGGAPRRLSSAAQVRAFNRSLPCGAVVTAVEPSAHGFVIATFRLTERPGRGACGDGAGRSARVALRIAAGRIRDWIRLQRVPAAPSETAPGTPA